MSMNNPTNSTTRSTDCFHERRSSADTNRWWSGSLTPPACPYNRKQALSNDLQKEVSPEYREHLYHEWDIDIPLRLFLTKKVIETFEISGHYEEEGGLLKILSVLDKKLSDSHPRLTRIPLKVFRMEKEIRCRCICLHAVWSTVSVHDPSPSVTVVMPDED